ncbi:MAG: DNA glycosylase [Clostridia bacterium]|nr:DNA glycosylase [Clostridia bacterium]MDD4386785.1 DNA glycosylase [Clostridia bacterium]
MIIEKEKLEDKIATKPDLIFKTKCFNLLDTLECGQCFRWKKIDNNSGENRYVSEFVGVISDRVIKIRQINEYIYVYSNIKENLKETIEYYFDLYNDYDKIEKEISKLDKNIEIAVKNSTGIHILNQSTFETLISYIISANNNIPRIKKSVEEISKRYGKKVIFENKEYYLFPTIQELSKVEKEDFKACSVGFRDKYIVKTVADLMENNIYAECTSKLTNVQLKKVLMTFVGVGPKVADCIMLFSYGRQDVFPIDVWIKRVMEKLYLKKESTIKEVFEYAEDYFGSYAGIIQQHLFYNIRKELI